MIKTIIFDLGSVLFNEGWEALNKDVVRKFGISTLIRSAHGKKINKEYDKASIGKSNMKILFGKICQKNKIKINLDELCEFYIKSYNKHKILNSKLLDKIKQLRKNYLLICHTDTNDLHFKGHQRQKWFKVFHKHFASHLIGKRKYDKRAFIIIMKQIKINPKETLFIDDQITNIKNARVLGMKAIQFKNNKDLFKKLRRFVK